jgi:hypothetical protein
MKKLFLMGVAGMLLAPLSFAVEAVHAVHERRRPQGSRKIREVLRLSSLGGAARLANRGGRVSDR